MTAAGGRQREQRAPLGERFVRAARVFLDRRVLIILVLGFSSGLPLALSGSTLLLWMKDVGVDLGTIGLFALVGVPYTIKFLWAPIVDAFDVPVLGIVENMSYFIAPDTGARYDIFGHGGARKEAERLDVPFLGEVPLVMAIRETSDAGTPIVVAEPDGPHAQVYREIATRAWEGVVRARAEGGHAPPKIVVE